MTPLQNYRARMDKANAYYRETLDLAGFQARIRQARELLESESVETYRDVSREAELREALAQGGRVYGTLESGETVRLHNVGNLYALSDTTGAPETPIVARLVGPLEVKHTTISDIIGSPA